MFRMDPTHDKRRSMIWSALTVSHEKSHLRLVLMTAVVQRVLDNTHKVTREQIEEFLEICRVKYLRAKIEPGE